MLNEKDKTNIEEILYAISHIENYLKTISSLEELSKNSRQRMKIYRISGLGVN
jgi:hypothetical protein